MKKLGLDRVMWGSDYPHHEGSTPFSRELMRRAFSEWTPAELDQVFTTTRGRPLRVRRRRSSRAAPPRSGRRPQSSSVPLEGVPKGATSPGFWS